MILPYLISQKMGLNQISIKYPSNIVAIDKRKGDYISGVYTKSKEDDSHRMILNVKNLNVTSYMLQTF